MSVSNNVVFEAGWQKVLDAPRPVRLKSPLSSRTRDAYRDYRNRLLSSGSTVLSFEVWRTINEGRDTQLDLFIHKDL